MAQGGPQGPGTQGPEGLTRAQRAHNGPGGATRAQGGPQAPGPQGLGPQEPREAHKGPGRPGLEESLGRCVAMGMFKHSVESFWRW